MNSQHDGIAEAVIGLAADHDTGRLEVLLESLSHVQLRSLAASLATRAALERDETCWATRRSLRHRGRAADGADGQVHRTGHQQDP